MDSSGFSSPRFDCFPAGLRVLVVDDDPTWLKILEKMLKKCNYEVTTCNLAREALHLLRERKDGFDIVISDVNMPDMDGFKLLEHVGLEMDLPVIMMSVDGETSRVMKGVQHGACDYLLKPIRMKELKNIWQHVFRKRIHEVRDVEGHESFEEIHMFGNGNEQGGDEYLFSGDMILGKKRKDVDNNHDERMCGDPSSAKKARVVWTVDLHQKFVKAVNQIGFDKVGPKKILDLMGVSWLTRENVASHLQKYRLYLSRLPKGNELKTGFCGIKHSDFAPKDPFANICFPNSQNSITLQQKIGTKESYNAHAHKDDSKTSEGNMKGVFPSMSVTEFKKSQFGDVIDPPKSSTTRISFGHSYGSLDPEVRSKPKLQIQYPWAIKAPSIQFKQERKPHLANEKANKVESTSSLFSAQPQIHLLDSHGFEKIPCTKNQGLEQNLFDELESSQKNFILGTGSASKLWDDGLNCFSPQGEFLPQNINFGNIESFGRVSQDLIVDIPPQLYDNFSFDYPSDPLEYHAIDQGVYIA